MKKYLIASALVFFFALLIAYRAQVNKNERLIIENNRLSLNNSQLLSDSNETATLLLKEKEVTGRLKIERDSFAAAVKIKPEQITKIVHINNYIRDTIKVQVPVIITGKNEWKISDTGECFKWAANAILNGDSLKVTRMDFEYSNRTTETYYRKRPNKFLFIRYGKFQNYQAVSSECGTSAIKTFNFIK